MIASKKSRGRSRSELTKIAVTLTAIAVPVQSEQCMPAMRARMRARSGRLAGSWVQRGSAASMDASLSRVPRSGVKP